jgi:hypothetical protein
MGVVRPDGKAEVNSWLLATCTIDDIVLDGGVTVWWQAEQIGTQRAGTNELKGGCPDRYAGVKASHATT